MIKIVFYVLLVCVTISSAKNSDSHEKTGSITPSDLQNTWSWMICKNKTNAQSFLSSIRQLLSNLEGNGSYTQVFEKHSNVVAYYTDDTKTALFSLNCTEFFSSLRVAQHLDEQGMVYQHKLEENAARLYIEMVQNFITSNISPDRFF
ncbi:unnamed protein product [Rotaria socialis]|uniref:Uncharacterized protein n=1 Tax=Rotaria socialis TaxID=392032 RepID=A0A817XPB1_9BILA|nr:unnamed protein product [Rotaria socialis]